MRYDSSFYGLRRCLERARLSRELGRLREKVGHGGASRTAASCICEVLDGRRVLDARMAEMTERFGGKPIPLPSHWGGYRLKPDMMEFWQGRPNRLHDRFRYSRQADGSWHIDRLSP